VYAAACALATLQYVMLFWDKTELELIKDRQQKKEGGKPKVTQKFRV
jgi:hypothetical protein